MNHIKNGYAAEGRRINMAIEDFEAAMIADKYSPKAPSQYNPSGLESGMDIVNTARSGLKDFEEDANRQLMESLVSAREPAWIETLTKAEGEGYDVGRLKQMGPIVFSMSDPSKIEKLYEAFASSIQQQDAKKKKEQFIKGIKEIDASDLPYTQKQNLKIRLGVEAGVYDPKDMAQLSVSVTDKLAEDKALDDKDLIKKISELTKTNSEEIDKMSSEEFSIFVSKNLPAAMGTEAYKKIFEAKRNAENNKALEQRATITKPINKPVDLQSAIARGKKDRASLTPLIKLNELLRANGLKNGLRSTPKDWDKLPKDNLLYKIFTPVGNYTKYSFDELSQVEQGKLQQMRSIIQNIINYKNHELYGASFSKTEQELAALANGKQFITLFEPWVIQGLSDYTDRLTESLNYGTEMNNNLTGQNILNSSMVNKIFSGEIEYTPEEKITSTVKASSDKNTESLGDLVKSMREQLKEEKP